MIEKKVVSQLIEEKLASSSNYLVDVVIKPGNLIVVEIDNDEAVSIDDCAELSRYLEEHLDRDVEDYELEVGSAVEKKVKPEGAKRKVTVVEDESYTFDEIKYTKYLIRFK